MNYDIERLCNFKCSLGVGEVELSFSWNAQEQEVRNLQIYRDFHLIAITNVRLVTDVWRFVRKEYINTLTCSVRTFPMLTITRRISVNKVYFHI